MVKFLFSQCNWHSAITYNPRDMKVWLGLVRFYGTSTILGNAKFYEFKLIYWIYIWIVRIFSFNGTSNLGDYLVLFKWMVFK